MGKSRTGIQLPHSRRSAPAEALALCLRSRQARVDALLNARALDLGDAPQTARDQPAGRRARVDPLAQRYERHAPRLPFVERQHQVSQVATEAIESPAHDTL